MGRRKRRNSDIDLTIEENFDRRRDDNPRNDDKNSSSSSSPPTDDDDDDERQSTTENDKDGNNNPSTISIPVQKKQKTLTEEEKIEALRRKKQERKQRKKEKRVEQTRQNEERKELQLTNAKKIQEAKEKEAKKKLEEKSKDNKPFTTIRKGVQYQDVLVGKGPPVQDRKKVRVSYTLRAKHRYGKILDSSADFGFRLGRGDVIDGWDIGLQGMRQGGKRYLIIPPQAGYGQQNVGAGPGGILFFEVTILSC